MKKIKRIAALIVSLILALALCSCSGKKDGAPEKDPNEREVKTRVSAVKSLEGYGAYKIMTDRSYAYDMKYYGSADEVVSLIESGETDIAVLPAAAAAKVYNDGKAAVKMICTAQAGGIHAVSKDAKIKSVGDLKGRTVCMLAEKTAGEILMDAVFEENGLDPEKDFTLVEKASYDELTALAKEKPEDVYILPSDFAGSLLTKEKFKQAFSLNKMWKAAFETAPVTACIIAREDYIRENPEIISEFLGFVEISLNYTANNETCGQSLTENGFFEDASLAYSAVSGANYEYLDGEAAKAACEKTFEILFADEGQIPGNDFYYIAT